MAIAHEPIDDLPALRDLIEEHRRILNELERKLAAHLPDAPAALPENVIPLPSAVRLERNEARRAARRARRSGEEGLWVAFPAPHQRSDRATQLREIADARRRIWFCSQTLLTELDSSPAASVRDTLDEILRTELAIQAVVDSIALPPVWQDIAEELSRASDVIVEAAREHLASDAGNGPALRAAIGRMVTAQSTWSRSWRTFVQVVPPTAR